MESEPIVGGRRPATVVIGPVAHYAAGFRHFLIAQSYARRTITVQVSLMAHLSCWLQAEGLTVDALRCSADINRFFAERRARGGLVGVGERAGRPAWFPARPSGHRRAGGGRGTPAEWLLADYRRYLRERGTNRLSRARRSRRIDT